MTHNIEANVKDKDGVSTSQQTINTLSNGFVKLYEHDVFKANITANELIGKQTKLIDQLTKENDCFSNDVLLDIQQMNETLKINKEKLISIKKDMTDIHNRTRNIKKRADMLQQFKTNHVNTE